MPLLNFDQLQATPIAHEPFDYMVVRNVLSADALAALRSDFPAISRPGLFPLSSVSGGAAFNALIEEVQGEEFQDVLEDKFNIDLSKRPQMITVRGHCRARDGKIHTDTFDKILTVLIYLNGEWPFPGGNLRLLHGPNDIEDMIAEVPPEGGTMIAFKPSPQSWHGHKPYEGERRYVMINWMADAEILAREVARHRLSATVKRVFGS